MPQLTGNFGPIPSQVVLDTNGSGTVTFQPNGNNARITTLFVKVSTAVNQAAVTIYKGQVSDTNIVGNTNSGSTGAPAFGNIDLFDGETLYVVWTGGDAGATATATFVGKTIPLADVGGSELRWTDPIAAADGSLIFPAIKSPNYVAGVSGWRLDRNGNIELNTATVRGTVDVKNASTGSEILISTIGNNSRISLKGTNYTNPAANASYVPGDIHAVNDNNGTAQTGFLYLQSPWFNTGFTGQSSILLSSEAFDGSAEAKVTIDGSGLSYPVGFYVNANMYQYGIDGGRGWVNGIDTASSSAAIGNTETVVLTLPSFFYRANRAYKIELSTLVSASVAGNSPTFRLRKTNATGQRFTNGTPYCGNTSPTTGDFKALFTVGAVDVTATIVLTLQGSATFNATMFGSTTTTTSLDVYDIGPASKHPNVPVLV